MSLMYGIVLDMGRTGNKVERGMSKMWSRFDGEYCTKNEKLEW